MKPIFVLVAFLLLSASTCQPGETVISPVDVEQIAGSWKLIKPLGYDVTLVIERGFQTWEREPDKVFKLSGKSSVNLYTSSLSYENRNDSRVTVGTIGSTKMAGPPEAMQFEQSYYTSLQAVTRYELTNQNRLRLYYGTSESGVLEYEKIK